MALGPSLPELRLPGLDGLRAVAVVAVILFHLDLPGVLPAGFLGVDIFFTLSGFIITALLLREHARDGRVDWLAFCGRRARRLLPPTLTMIAVATPTTAVVAPEALERLRSDLPAALLYLSNWWQIQSQQSYFEAFGRPPVLRHLWSLAIEEQFYLVWPLVVGFVLHRRGRGLLAATCAMAALASTAWMAFLHQGLAEGGDPSRVYLGADTHVMGLFVGAALACIVDPWKATAAAGPSATWPRTFTGAALRRGIGLATVLAAVLAMQQLHEASAALFQGGFLVLAAATSLLIVASLQNDTWLARGLRWPLVQWLGTRSFSLYLWHWPIVVWLWPAPDAPTAQTVINTLTRLALTGAAAELSYRFIERGGLPRRVVGGSDCGGDKSSLLARPLWIRGAVAASVSACALLLGYGALPVDAAASVNPPTTSVAGAPGPMPPLPAAQTAAAATSPSAQFAASRLAAAPQVVATTMPAAAIPEAAETADSAARAAPPARGCVHVVGDSVVLGARPLLQRTLSEAVVNAEVGRQGHQAHQVLRQLMADRTLCPKVVLHIGTNGYLQEPPYLELVGALARRGRVVLVNIRADRRWTVPNNALIARAAREVPGVRLVDWSSASDAQRHYFVQDGIHLTVAGMSAFAEHIRAAVAGTEPAADAAALLASTPPATAAVLAPEVATAPASSAAARADSPAEVSAGALW